MGKTAWALWLIILEPVYCRKVGLAASKQLKSAAVGCMVTEPTYGRNIPGSVQFPAMCDCR